MTGRSANEIIEFTQRWNESCLKENDRVRKVNYSVEYLREQSMRLKEQVKTAEEKEGAERTKFPTP